VVQKNGPQRDKFPPLIWDSLLLSFAESFLAWLAATGISAFAGLGFAFGIGKYLKPRYFLAFSLGVILWVFMDVIDNAAKLDVDASFSGGWEQFNLVVLFVIAIIVFLYLDRSVFSPGVSAGVGLAIPLLIAIGVGIHGVGEGGAFGEVSSTTPLNSLFLVFGGEASGAAYVLHKFLESMAIGAGYLMFSREEVIRISKRMRDSVLLVLAFVMPSVVAMVAGYYIEYNIVYFYALGSGALLFVLLKFAGPLYTTRGAEDTSGSLRTGAWIVAGFLCVYLAALLHSYVS